MKVTNTPSVELRKLKFGLHSEETIDFTADVYIDGKLFAHASNRGHGGSTNVHSASGVSNEYFAEMDKYFRSLPPMPDYPTLKMDMEMYVDNLVEDAAVAKDTLKFKKKLDKQCLNSIVVTTAKLDGYRFIPYKGHTIEGMLKIPQGLEALRKTITKMKADLKPGEYIYNTNLGELQSLAK